MFHLLRRFQHWLNCQSTWLTAWLPSQQEQNENPEQAIEVVSPELAHQLSTALHQLPSPVASCDEIRTLVEQALQQWLDAPQPENHTLVLLSSPVREVTRILDEQIEPWIAKYELPVRCLSLTHRSVPSRCICAQLETELGFSHDSTSQHPEVMVIPKVEWCFLRSVDGLTGIDYLEDQLSKQSSRFWILALDPIGWHYLSATCGFSAYCSEPHPVSPLDGDALQSWLSPVIAEFQIQFEPSTFKGNGQEPINQAETTYFQRLAEVSEGNSTVARQVFLNSIRCVSLSTDTDETQLQVVLPSLPTLPMMATDYDYLLYALLLHGDLTLLCLAESLGDEPTTLKHQIQTLHRQGVVEQQSDHFQVAPIHYPNLKRKLALNNFFD